ncbi:MAG: hypothetical protein J1E64_00180 [Acetatifactor sp.]|nr:hypothetical protein [Acetatifactor sp.]
MKKKWIYGMTACTLAAAMLTGCGDGNYFLNLEGDGSGTPAALTGEPLLSETKIAILNYELQYQSGEFSQEDYQALAALYKEAGLIRKQRDMLEQCYRLYDDEHAFEELQTIAVNLAEEDAAILGEAQTMLQNLELEDYLGESIHMIFGQTWFDTMMPKLGAGMRSYFLCKDGQTVLTIQVGYDETGVPFSNVWHNAGDQTTLLSWTENTVQLLTTDLVEENYNGDFTLWTINGNSGDIKKEQGTMANGIYTGVYQVELHIGSAGGDVYDLWSNRNNMSYSTYVGAFDGSGVTTVDQPSASNLASFVEGSDHGTCVVYAYDENKENCLFIGVVDAEEAENFAFGIGAMGISAYPSLLIYEPVEQTEPEGGETEEVPQVRIFDGQIQFFSGNKWVTLGSVSQYQKEDPFRGYGEQKVQSDEAKRNAASSEEGERGKNGQGVGSIEPEKPTAPSTPSTPSTTRPSRPSTTTPSTPSVPSTPAPAPSTPPAPSYDDDDDDDDDGGNYDNGNNSDDGQDNNGGGDTGNEGGDVDIEWTPDLM